MTILFGPGLDAGVLSPSHHAGLSCPLRVQLLSQEKSLSIHVNK